MKNNKKMTKQKNKDLPEIGKLYIQDITNISQPRYNSNGLISAIDDEFDDLHQYMFSYEYNSFPEIILLIKLIKRTELVDGYIVEMFNIKLQRYGFSFFTAGQLKNLILLK